jgi:hypothetical protein
MLQRLADHIADSYTRAADSEDRARQAPNDELRANHLRLAQGWRHLAKSYEFVESLERFLLDLHKKGWPLKVEDLPRPPEENG